MEQYIPKNALVAEIENYKNSVGEDGEHCSLVVGRHKGQKMASEHFLSFLDTLEVKDVDIEKELESWRHNHFHGKRDKAASGEYLERISQLALAIHFFELGLKVQKGEEV